MMLRLRLSETLQSRFTSPHKVEKWQIIRLTLELCLFYTKNVIMILSKHHMCACSTFLPTHTPKKELKTGWKLQN